VNGNTCTVTLNSDREVSVEYILPIYRRKHPSNGDWLYSTNVNEAKTTYTLGGIVAFYLYSAPKAGRSVLYRCLRSTTKGPDHFLSQSPNCENQKYEGPLGYVSNAAETTGSLLLQRYYHPAQANHFTQAGSQVVPAGFNLEGPQGYVPRQIQWHISCTTHSTHHRGVSHETSCSNSLSQLPSIEFDCFSC